MSMIDMKLNDLPEDSKGDFANRPESELTEEEKEIRRKQLQAAHNTRSPISADTNLSVGSRGVDVSGVSTGSGAGSGSESVTPSGDDPVNAEIMEGPRGVGLNYRNNANNKTTR